MADPLGCHISKDGPRNARVLYPFNRMTNMTKSSFRGALCLTILFLSTGGKSKSSYLSKNDIILIETFCRIDNINIIMKRDLNSHRVEVYLSFVKLQ